MGAPLMDGDNRDLWVSNSVKDYFCDLVAEIAKLHGNDISLAFEEEPGIAGSYGISGLGIEMEGFFGYFGGKDNFIAHLKICRAELDFVCESARVAKNMYHLFSWVLHILNEGCISEETQIYEMMPPSDTTRFCSIDRQKIGCPICKHYNFDGTCPAFLDRIPMMFLSGERGHTEPIEGQQNDDIVFEWISPEEQQLRAKKILAKYDLDSQEDRIRQQEEAHI
jgi:hypothetical protein